MKALGILVIPRVTLDMIFELALPLPNVSQFPFSENFEPIMKSSENLKGLDQTFMSMAKTLTLYM